MPEISPRTWNSGNGMLIYRRSCQCQDSLLASDPGASLQGYTRKKLYIEHGDVFFCMEHGDVFFLVCPWPRPGLQGLNVTLKMPYSLRTRNVILTVAPGQALYILDICPEIWDESNGNSILRLWLQFILIFGALHSQLRKGHTTKKDIPMFLICIAFPQKGITKKDISMPIHQLISKS